MSTIHVLQTIFEIVLALVVVVCFIKQDSLIEWEEKQRKRFDRWQRRLRKRLVAAGDVFFSEPYLINQDGQKEPQRILTARQDMERR